MTRINAGIPAVLLTNKHLLAEHREMKRIPNAVRQGKTKAGEYPDTFRLGAGHVRFFYPRLGYLLRRYKQVHQECVSRGFSVQNYEAAWDGIDGGMMGDYHPSSEDVRTVVERINDRGGLREFTQPTLPERQGE